MPGKSHGFFIVSDCVQHAAKNGFTQHKAAEDDERQCHDKDDRDAKDGLDRKPAGQHARKERPHLEFYQLSDFRAACRRHRDRDGAKRLCLQQLDTGGVLIVNHSTRQNSVVLFDCLLRTDSGVIHGDWGYSGDDKPPWNIPPQSAISLSLACFFDMPDDYEVPEDLRFRVEFVTTSGKRFPHVFSRNLPDDS